MDTMLFAVYPVDQRAPAPRNGMQDTQIPTANRNIGTLLFFNKIRAIGIPLALLKSEWTIRTFGPDVP